MTEPARLRASDDDRDQAAGRLREALASGRLSPVEHQERLDAVYQAKTVAELVPITEDLPAGVVDDVVEDPTETRVWALFSKIRRVGQWDVPKHLRANARFGAIVLDMCNADFADREVTIEANSLFGKVELRVPENAKLVGNGGTAVFGKRTLPTSPASGDRGPVIRITGRSIFGHTRVNRGDRRVVAPDRMLPGSGGGDGPWQGPSGAAEPPTPTSQS